MNIHTVAARAIGVLTHLPTFVLGSALVATLGAPAAHADFGRLFFSAAERRALDEPAPPPPPPRTETPVAAPLPPRRINGVLRRPDGEVIVWRDGIAETGERHFHLTHALVLIPRAAPQQRVRVGEHWPPLPDAATALTLSESGSSGTQ